MGLQSKLAKQFVSRAAWSPADYDREWDSWLRDISDLLIASGRETFSPQAWAILNTIHRTANVAVVANNMHGLRDALTRYRLAAKQLLSTPTSTGSGNVAVANDPKVFQPAASERKSA